jgi:hypothetical protein
MPQIASFLRVITPFSLGTTHSNYPIGVRLELHHIISKQLLEQVAQLPDSIQ